MCGITGFISPNFSHNHLVRMTNMLTHRGPDASGIFFDENSNLGLGHRRLSIIDLSEAANQPLTSHCGRYKMVFNGEVYNFKEIAKTLNNTWKTSSDSEVVLEAFVKYGLDFLQMLNGMFSIAIYDLQENSLFLFRDRLGKKPLYIHLDDKDFIFSSEIKAITSIKNNLKINKYGLSNFLHFGFIPDDETIYESVNRLPAGCYGVFKNKKLTVNRYWGIDENIKSSTIKDFKIAKNQFKKILTDSVEKRLISDVPIGTFLSGGIDSSLVTSIASAVSKDSINTFSIGFKDAKFDESESAKQIAKHLKTNHHEFIVSEDDILSTLDKVLDNFDEPFSDSSCFPTFLVSKMARQYATVCLSGDGGDELFMGYGAYNWAKRLNNPMYWNFRKPIASILTKSKSGRKKRAALVFDSPKQNKMSHIFSQEQYLFTEKEIQYLLKDEINTQIYSPEKIQSNRKLTIREKQSFFDITNYLKDDLLVKVDRTSMLNSLEVRLPLLDYRLVEFALNVDESLKVSKSKIQKYLLKEVLYEYVPHNLLDRPKSGFSIPLERWLKNELSYLIDKYLSDDIIVEYQLFNLTFIKDLKFRFSNGEDYLYNRIWQIIIVNKFLQQNSDNYNLE